MHGPALSGWLLVALCGMTGAYCVLRMRSESGPERAGAAGEALMGFGMAAMAVPAAAVTPPGWVWGGYAVVFGGAALRALGAARSGGHHLHHLVGSLAMVYMSLAMLAPPGGGHAGHGAGAPAGVPPVTGALLAYYAAYVLRTGAALVPVPVAAGVAARGTRSELALACRLAMGLGMVAMLLAL
ncbi:DUF5134 domain-containing protein [Streptomyces sannanensis]|uniref:DUF5134 domain-containing protein n=1 Tax=Streptomyces sannanensis TaxID=285536 RepID=A0ABP6S4Z8_9ACTN